MRNRSRARRDLPPLVEAMEARRLMATVAGTLQALPTGRVAGRTVYVDLNGTGRLDPGEPTAVTGDDGRFTIAGVPAGSSTVRATIRPGETSIDRPITVTADEAAGVPPLYLVSGSPALQLLAFPDRFGPAPPDATRREVNALYEAILFRVPEPSGGDAAVAYLGSGGTAAGLASALLGSNEFRARTARADYAAILGRDGTAAEVDAWVARLAGGMAEERVAAAFFASDEYNHLHPTDADFVASAYVGILGRPASPGEVTTVTGLIAGGLGRSGVIGSLFGSDEGTARAVSGLYAEALGRPADPGGAANAASSLRSGSSTVAGLATALFGSAEFVAGARDAGEPTTLTIPDRALATFDHAGIVYVSDGPRIDRYDTRSGTYLPSWRLGGYLVSLDVSPDGKTLAVTDLDRPVIDLVDIATGAVTRVDLVPQGGESAAHSLAWGADGALVVSMGSAVLDSTGPSTLRRYDPATGSWTVVATDIPPFGLLSASADRRTIGLVVPRENPGTLRVYDVAARAIIASISSNVPALSVSVNADGSRFAVARGNGTHIYARSGSSLSLIAVLASVPFNGNGTIAGGTDATYSPTGRTLFAAETGLDRGLEVYDAATLTRVATLRSILFTTAAHNSGVGRMELSPDGRILALLEFGSVLLFDVSAYA